MAGEGSNAWEIMKVAVGLIVSAATAFTGYKTYELNQITREGNERLKQIELQLSRDRFGFDRLKDIYDRTEKYLSSTDQDERRGRALVVLIESLPDELYKQALAAIIRSETTNAAVASEAANVALAESDPIVPKSREDYEKGFVFAQGDTSKTDLSVYICENAGDVEATLADATRVGTGLAETGRYGRIKGSVWKAYDGLVPEPGPVSVVIDERQGEGREYVGLARTIGELIPGANVKSIPNPGGASPWMISVILCK